MLTECKKYVYVEALSPNEAWTSGFGAPVALSLPLNKGVSSSRKMTNLCRFQTGDK